MKGSKHVAAARTQPITGTETAVWSSGVAPSAFFCFVFFFQIPVASFIQVTFFFFIACSSRWDVTLGKRSRKASDGELTAVQRRLPPPGLPLHRGNEATDGSVFSPAPCSCGLPRRCSFSNLRARNWSGRRAGGGSVGVEGRRVRRPTGRREEVQPPAETMARIVLLFVFSVHTLA